MLDFASFGGGGGEVLLVEPVCDELVCGELAFFPSSSSFSLATSDWTSEGQRDPP